MFHQLKKDFIGRKEVFSMKSKNEADAALVNSISSYKNVYTAMNMDNQPFDVRKPPKLPEKFVVNVKNDSKIK
jgi:hypothetical protein